MSKTEIDDVQIRPGTANQILGVNSSGTSDEYKTLSGTSNQIIKSDGAGSITLSTPQDINTTSSPTFAATTVTNLFIGGVSSDPVSPVEGQLWYNTTTHQWIGFNGTSNVVLG